MNTNLWFLKKIYRYSRKRFLIMLGLVLERALVTLLSVIMIKIALDCVTVFHSLRYLVIAVVLERMASMLFSIADCSLEWQKKEIQNNRIREKIGTEIFDCARNFSLARLDQPGTYDEYKIVLEEIGTRSGAFIQSIENLLTNAARAFVTVCFAVTLDARFIGIALISAMIGILVSRKIADSEMKKRDAMIQDEREREYIKRVFYTPEYNELTRMSNAKDFLFLKYEKSVEKIKGALRKYQPCIARANNLNTMQVFALNFGLGALLLAGDFKAGKIGASSFTSIMFACSTLSGAVSGIVNDVSELKKQSLYTGKLYHFLNSNEADSVTGAAQMNGMPGDMIELENVHFHYEGNSEREILDGISLQIAKGEKIALVGENGVGKTTLVRLIEGLYQPSSGTIRIDGKDFGGTEKGILQQKISAVVQKPVHYAFTIAENIQMRETSDKDRERLMEVLRECGLWDRVSKLPKGLDTVLGKEFDEEGVDLSGGEKQKLAIARALYRNADILILDEPDAGLDPRAEAEMYERMFKTGRDKTVILISHRLYSMKMADRIYYIENGCIAEQGTHEELMNAGGRYARMYTMQEDLYRA